MNSFVRNIIICLVVISTMSLSVQMREQFQDLYNDFSTGESNAIYQHLDDIIFIKIGTSQGSYSKKQAKVVLDRFFQYNKPQKFQLVFDRLKADESVKYSIGYLYTGKGIFKTYLYIKIKDKDYSLQQIRIEKK